jgi:hypothetical protein
MRKAIKRRRNKKTSNLIIQYLVFKFFLKIGGLNLLVGKQRDYVE